jgi:hypothetical protein
LRWENAVHEKIVGLRGTALVLPYVYHHYGNVAPPALLARKHGAYYALGNRVPQPVSEAAATIDVYLEKAADVRRYRGSHPALVRPTLAAIASSSRDRFEAIDAGFARAQPSRRACSALRSLNETLRVELRRVEHPWLYRESTIGR